jgi:hypothetical protein
MAAWIIKKEIRQYLDRFYGRDGKGGGLVILTQNHITFFFHISSAEPSSEIVNFLSFENIYLG